ncbi:MAG: uncharacterized protein KVP18_004059 [Porospora cf. gigantea A]|uniref:uncharacterized protein n=1 Tax=Porospora cf. gigantea A TaxID=2853593 RepID=UPI00355AA522|nr:MAG: hypothetical protein KVP18_004059 [Porospora cf. gigantea A]
MTLNDPIVCAHHPYCSLDEGELRMWKSRWTRLALYIQFLVLSGSAMWGKPNLEAMILGWSDDPIVRGDLAERMSQCFNMGVVVYKLASVVAGFFLDYFGPRTSGVVGVLLHAIGVVLLAVDGLDTMYFQLAVPLILLSNQYTWNACLWASQLFPRQKKLVLSLISVSGDVSKFNYYWLLLLNLRGDAEYSTLFWWMFAVVLAEVLVPLLTMPADPDRIVVSVLEKRAQQKKAMAADNHVAAPQAVYFYHGLRMRTQMLTPYL